jgi:hypothetical protein
MKNVVFMMDIKLGGDGRYSESRSLPYKYSINSWKKWCDKNDCELFVLEDLLLPIEEMAICWQRYYLFDILDANGLEYDQVLMVDADTIVHPDCPNFFNMTDDKMTVVEIDGSWDWILRSMENYSKYVFDNKMFDWWKYFDCGFVLINKTHKNFFKAVTDFYNENKDNLIHLQETFHTGTDQTPVNFLTELYDIPKKYLTYEYNMCDMNRKEILGDDLLFTKLGWIYQFNAIPGNTDNNLTIHFMKKAYEKFYGSLND